MSRKHITFTCAGEQLVGTLDAGECEVGVLIVSGGNEVRSGAFSGQAHLATRLAFAGYPVFRFDRRGVGDSTGTNTGFKDSAMDITAALATFREHVPGLRSIAGFGICDAASALMLTRGAGCDALVLANPWVVEDSTALPPPSVIRARYIARMRDSGAILRLVSGKVSLRRLLQGVKGALRPTPPPTGLARDVTRGLASFPGPVRILLAERDRTAQIFDAIWPKGDPRVFRCPDASHAFAEAKSEDWLFQQILTAISE
ncbi:hydrolase 1, exosortase A system-associated [Croceicoccus estronivorus]|uniref:hydrolase 1, exosortase A system-associated n=1 Tax=Croceicoccus estronivorus TaxID=1172626 RepID=UPI000832AB42|nr:hydrolase 1, exosortase A system-associated [Croceicoccus estronivorus]OCC23150.1 hydrolase 1, exosortase A system-associated [Croceicoccus estronivorus]